MHHWIKLGLWLAGAVHLLIALANFFLPAMLDYQGNLARMTPIMRQIFRVHAAYIMGVVAGVGLACFFYADDLAGGTGLGRSLSVFLAAFWLSRVGVQFLYYDPAVRRERPWGHLVFAGAFLYLGAVFTAAACFPGK